MYSTPEDVEIAGFIASLFAYGRVDLFIPVIERILKPCGKHPALLLKNFTLKKHYKCFKGINYRFNREKDIICLMYMLNYVLKEWGSLRNLFYHHYKPEDNDIGPALKGFVDLFLSIDTSSVYGKNIKPNGLAQFFPSPEKGSACKRMNLFLRWMIRTADIDMGIWDKIPPSKLIIPLDTHISKISRCLGLTKRTASDWKTAREITTSLKKLDPIDPLKYDFALCHHGISGLCKGMNHAVHTKEKKFKETCKDCILYQR